MNRSIYPKFQSPLHAVRCPPCLSGGAGGSQTFRWVDPEAEIMSDSKPRCEKFHRCNRNGPRAHHLC